MNAFLELWHIHPASVCPRIKNAGLATHTHRNGEPFATRWRRRQAVPGEIFRWRSAFGNTNVFQTLNRYSIPERQENEPFSSDFALDLDLDAASNSTDALEESRHDAVLVDEYIRDRYGIQPRLFFSGSKGFHVEIPSETLDLSPAPDFHKPLKVLARQVALETNARTIDWSIYSVRQAWRLPNSLNLKSELYKIPLTPMQLRLSAGEIRKLARSPRSIAMPRTTKSKKMIEAARVAREQATAEIVRETAERTAGADPELALQTNRPIVPLCIKALLTQGITPRGLAKSVKRNMATLILAEWLKAAGTPFEEAQRIALDHALTVLSPFSSSRPEEIASSTIGAVKTAYAGSQYRFQCRIARSKGYPCSGRCPAYCP